VVTTHAPGLPAPAAEASARSARAVLDRLPLRERPPVLAGSSHPLSAPGRPEPNPGVDFLMARAREHSASDRLVVLIIGAPTDVASALLIDPTLADRVEIVAMAFDSWPRGGDPFNVRNDVRAWQVVLASRAPLAVGDVAATRRELAMTREKARALLGDRGPA